MLKFATKKPPRLKQSTSEHEGHLFSDEGEGHLVGNFVSRYPGDGGSSVEDSVDSGINQSVDFTGFKHNMDYDHGFKENVGYPGYGSRSVNSPIKETWKAFNVKYGKVGVEKEIEIPVDFPTREVGMSRNGHVFEGQRSPEYVGQRSHYNPGYLDNTMTSRNDLNRNLYQYPSASIGQPVMYPRGSGYHFATGGQGHMPMSQSQVEHYNVHQQYPNMHGNQQSHNVNVHLSPNVDTNRNYGQPYSLDSTASMSLDSVSTIISDPSTKSTSEYLDYDTVMDMHQTPRKQMECKSAADPHKHQHIHLGRGTHGLCEGSSSPLRPGSTESHMTSSLRKSPGYHKSGHHVRWGPGVVNSSHNDPTLPESVHTVSASKKPKKKTSLRSLLNLPKFPVSDDDLNEHGNDLEKNLKGQTGIIDKPDKQKKSSKQTAQIVSKAPLSTELACLQYKREFPAQESGLLSKNKSPVKRNVPKLNITSANQFQSIFSLPITTQSYLVHPGEPKHTRAITQPIMHVGKQESPTKGPVNSVRPFLINGQSNEIQDYDNCDETQPQPTRLISVKGRNMNETGVFSPSTITVGSPLNVKLSQKEDVLNGLQTTRQQIPVTFDTFVTLGRPSERNVVFDTFVTLGRPYATSTPVPNGSYTQEPVKNLGNTSTNIGVGSSNLHQSTGTTGQFSGSNSLFPVGSGQFPVGSSEQFSGRSGHFPVGSVQFPGSSVQFPGSSGQFPGSSGQFPGSSGQFPGSSGHISVGGSGQFLTTNVTDSKTYSTGAIRPTSVPVVTNFTHTDGRFPVHVDQVAHRDMLQQGQPRSPGGPYILDNRNYGKLSSPPSTFISWTPAPVVHPPGVHVQTWQSHDQVTSHDTIGNHSNKLGFKESCTYRERETQDYDDDVFLNLMSSLTSPTTEQPIQVRRKLDFEGVSRRPEQVVTSCVQQINHELNNDILNQNHSGYPKVQAVPGVTQTRGVNMSTMSNMNEMVNRDHVDGGDGDTILDLVYITERIISMSFASEEHETTYKYNLKEVTRMLKTKHHDNYLVINISDKRSDLAKFCPKVLEYGWPENLAPPLERLCSICKAIDNWLEQDPNYVVVVHCKGGRGRIAVVIAAYMRYSNICASADQALDRFAMKRFYDDKLGGLPQPSQRRYVHYFAGLLSGAIQINNSALYLHHILIHGVPNFDTKGGCRPFIKVYQGMHPIFTSGVYNVTDNMQKVCISISPGIPLKGDILIKCYHKKNKAGQREMMWGCQFQTCAISHNSLVFSKNELDFAINDPRFPDVGKVEFVFGNNSEGLVQVSDFKSDVTVPVDDSTDALTRWDSYENFGRVEGKMETDVNANGLPSSEGVDSFRVTQLDHSQGPVDGNLYAQVNKRKLESQIVQNGPSKLPNGGSFTSSLDSVPVVASHKSSSESWSYSMREQNQPTMTSYSTSSKSYSNSTSPRSKMALDEKTQLDQILSDLLNEQAFVSQKSPPGTRSFKTVEDHISPEGNVVVQRGDVTYKIPEVRQEKHYSVKTETKTVKEDNSFKPVNAFSYTPSSPDTTRSFEPIRSPGSPKAGSLPYRTDYENRYQTNGEGEHSLSWLQQQQAKLREKSQERDPKRVQNEQQIMKELVKNKYFAQSAQRSNSEDETKTSSSTVNGPTSPYMYTVSRTHYDKSPEPFRPHDTIPVVNSHTTYITEQTSSTSSKVSNKPPPSPSLGRTVTPTQQAAPAPPPQRTSSRDYMQHQHQSRNRSNSGGGYQQTSSSSYKTESYTQPRTVQRHYSESAYDREQFEKQQHAPRSYTTPPMSPRSISPQTYQTYKTVYKTVHQHAEDEPDFVQPVKAEKVEKSMEQRQQTVQDVNKPHYITEVIVQRTGGSDSKNSTLNRNVEQDRKESDHRLEALEKSLQAASNSIMATSPWQQKQQQNVMKQETRYETRSYETRSERREEKQQQSVQQSQVEAPPPPKKIEVIEEDRIALRPIGPGVHQLEPEGSHTGTLGRDSTLGRATTPSFPTSPQSAESIIQAVHEKVRRMSLGSNQSLNSIGSHVTPPFPTTPRTPYQNLSVSAAYPPGPPLVRHQGSPRRYGSTGHHSSQQSLNSVFEREPSDIEHYNSIVSRQILRSTTDPTYASIPDDGYPKGAGHVISPTGTLSSSEKMQYSSYQQNQQYNTQTLPTHQHQQYNTQTLPTHQHQQYNTQTLPTQQHMQYNTLPTQQYQHSNQYSSSQQSNQVTPQYQAQTLPHNTQVSQSFQTNTLPHQTSTLPHQSGFNQQQQQQQFEQRQYHQTHQSSSSQQYNTQQYSTNSQDGSLHVETNPNRMLMTQQHGRSPSSPGSPPSPGNLQSLRQQLDIAHNMSNSAIGPGPHSATGQSSPSVYFGLSRRGSLTSLADSEAVHSTPKFVKDTSKYWYKPNISREEAIIMLKDRAPGTFVVRDSNSFPGAFGLALKVATLPPNVQTKSTGDPMADLVRHFLIEPTSKGVRLRGCSNEPVFGSLASLVYQHSITPLSLPCKLALPEADASQHIEMTSTTEMPSSASALLAQGAACNVVYLNTIDTESLTGPQAVARACKLTFENPPAKTTMVHFKVSNQGITLTDNQRKLFFRRHYPVAAVTYCGMDPEDRKWKRETDVPGVQMEVRVFGFVARKQGSISDNSCHLFAELDPDQPASAIVNFVTKVMIGQGKIKS